MRIRDRRYGRPRLESLESMTLLSGVAAAAMSLPIHAEVATAATTTGKNLTLNGTDSGVFLSHTSSTHTAYAIEAAGTLTPVGKAVITGTLDVATGISSGPPSGTLHLITRKGTLTLQVPRSVAIPAGLPTATSPNEIVDTYLITKGTGVYKHDTGSGAVEFTFTTSISAGAYHVGRVSVTFLTLPPTTTAI